MTRKLAPLDKEKLRILRDSETRTASALAQHRKICADCHPDDNWPRRACNDGWDMAKKAMRAANDLSVFKGSMPDDEIQGQVGLW